MIVLRKALWLCCLFCCACNEAPRNIQQDEMAADPISASMEVDSVTGLVKAEHFELVRAQCTSCHTAQLITQNRATREGWEQMIRWMQQSQGLWDLGVNEEPILDYLEQHYAPVEQGRRIPLTDIEWYELN